MSISTKGGRRAYLKRFSMRSGIIPNKGVIAEYHSRNIRYPEEAVHDGIPLNAVPDTLYLSTWLHAKNVPPRVQVMRMRKMWQGIRGQGIAEYYCTVLKPGRYQAIKMFHCGHEYIFIKEEGNQLSRSIIYTSRDRAMRDYPNHITWVAFIDQVALD